LCVSNCVYIENESDVVLSETVPEVLAISKITDLYDMNHQPIEKGLERGEDEEEKNSFCSEADLAAELPDITDIYEEKDILNRIVRRKMLKFVLRKDILKED
jgi:hypothetical protein